MDAVFGPKKTYDKLYDKINFAANNYDSENVEDRDLAQKFANKYNLYPDELKSFRYSESDPVTVRNTKRAAVIDKVVNQFPGIDTGWSPIGPTERFRVKNIIDEDPALQVEFLKRQGYEARFNNGNLEARKEGEVFSVVDPSRFEISDIFDITGDLVTGAVEGFVTGLRALSGPFGFMATAPVGAATSGSLELGKQFIANQMGLRNDYNIERAAVKAGVGAIAPLLPRIAGKAPSLIGDIHKYELKPNAPELQQIGQRMGAVPTKGMLNKNPLGQELENVLWQSRPVTGLNRDLINQVQSNIDATDKYAEGLFKNRSGMSKVDAGREIQPSIVAKLNEKIDRSEKLYSGLEEKLGLRGFVVDKSPINKNLDVLETQFKFDKTGRGWAEDIRTELDKLNTINDLRLFNRRLNNDIQRYHVSDPPLARASQILLDRSKALIDETFNGIIENKALDLSRVSPDKAAEFTKYINGLRNDLKNANRLYAEANFEAGSILRTPQTAKMEKGPVSMKVAKIEGKDFQKLWNDMYSGGNLKKSQWLEKTYPDEFNLARNTRLQQLWDQAITKRTSNNQSFGSKISQRIRSLSDTEKEILFGKEGIAKANDLATWFANQPITVGPSGTPKGLEIMGGITNLSGKSLNAFRYWLSNQSPGSKAVKGTLNLIDKTVNNPATRGGASWGGKYLFSPRGDEPQQNN